MEREEVIYCLKAQSERYSEVCEECPLYGQTGVDHCCEDALQMAINALQNQPVWIPVSEDCRKSRKKMKYLITSHWSYILYQLKAIPTHSERFGMGSFSRMVGKNVRLRPGCHCRNRTWKVRREWQIGTHCIATNWMLFANGLSKPDGRLKNRKVYGKY